MLITTVLLALTSTIQGPLPPQNAAPSRGAAHFRCLRIDTLDQACIAATSSTSVLDFMTFNSDNHMDGPTTHVSQTLAHISVASGSFLDGMSATSTMLATAINITPPGTSTFVPQVTANIFGQLTTQDLNFQGTTQAAWDLPLMTAGGTYRVLPRSDMTSGFANLHYILTAYCVGVDSAGAVDPFGLTTMTVNAGASTLFIMHLGPNAGWSLTGTLAQSSDTNPNAAPLTLFAAFPDNFNQTWFGTEAVAITPTGGGIHTVGLAVTNANTWIMMSPNQADAVDWTIGGSAFFHIRKP